jgi:hypothetical protein
MFGWAHARRTPRSEHNSRAQQKRLRDFHYLTFDCSGFWLMIISTIHLGMVCVRKMAASAGVWLLAMSAALAGIHNPRRTFVVSSPLPAESSACHTLPSALRCTHTHTYAHTHAHTPSANLCQWKLHAARRHAGQLALGVWPFLDMRPPSLEDHQRLPERCTGRPTTPFTSVPIQAHVCETCQKC